MTGKDRPKRRVLFSAWFLSPERIWIGEYLDPARYECTYVGLAGPMMIGSERTSPKKWCKFLFLALKTRWHLLFRRYDLVVSAFPPGGFMLALVNRLTFERTQHVIWNFNCGHVYRGVRRYASRFAFRHVKFFIVHTGHERRAYAEIFAKPEDQFRFAYLTGPCLDREDYAGARERFGLANRYVAALGSSGRDYETLFKAVESLDIQTVIVTHRYAIKGLDVPPQVKVLESIPQDDYFRVLTGASLCVIPINNRETASGQMTLIQAMNLGVPVVATRCVGTEDYLLDGETGRFVGFGDAKHLRDILTELLANSSERERLAKNALDFAREHFFDQANARELERLFRLVGNERTQCDVRR